MRSRLVPRASAMAILALFAVILIGLSTGPRSDGDRAYELEQRLRCPVCKSVSIAESMSDTATAMRAMVDEQIAAGRSDEEIIDYFRARYGDWVLLDPPFEGTAIALWMLPLGAASIGVTVLFTRRRKPLARTDELDHQDRARVAAALGRMRATPEPDDQP